MSETNGTTPAPEGATLAEQPSQAAAARALVEWGAPHLRPTFTPIEQDREEWPYPCPPWCTGDNPAHDPERVHNGRSHRSVELLVRQDGAGRYFAAGRGGEPDEEGTIAGHLAVVLTCGARDLTPRIRMTAARSTQDGQGREDYPLPAMYFDEVRELIAVLQHLMRVGLEGTP